jgi:hypothetical protein
VLVCLLLVTSGDLVVEQVALANLELMLRELGLQSLDLLLHQNHLVLVIPSELHHCILLVFYLLLQLLILLAHLLVVFVRHVGVR